MLGKVKWYNPKKGYGFIAGDDGVDYFVPYCNVETVSGGLDAGYNVEFQIATTERGRMAEHVKLL